MTILENMAYLDVNILFIFFHVLFCLVTALTVSFVQGIFLDNSIQMGALQSNFQHVACEPWVNANRENGEQDDIIEAFFFFRFLPVLSIVRPTLSQVYPTHARSLGTSASTTANWVGNALVSATFLTLANSSLGKSGTFWLYAVIGILGWIWLYACMPETKRVSLEAVEHLLVRPGDPPVLQGDGVDDCGERVNSRVAEPAGTHAGSVMSGTDHRPDGFAPLVDDD